MSHRVRSTFDGVRINGDGEFLCKCNFATREFCVKKEKSPYKGLRYWACAKHVTDSSKCNTWIWVHEDARVRALIPPAMRLPQTPRKQVDIRIFGQLTPPKSLVRKAGELHSFDSGLGDLSDEDIEPSLPSPSRPSSRPAKKARYTDSATQTDDALDIHPAGRALPRRRLFDEFLDAPRNNSNANPSLFTPQKPRKIRSGLFTPPTTGRSMQHQLQTEQPKTPTKSTHNLRAQTAAVDIDSDQESYGWDDSLDGAILEVADSVE